MQDRRSFRFDPLRELARGLGNRLDRAKDGVTGAAATTDRTMNGRALTRGELRMIEQMFGSLPGIDRARVFPRNFWWPYPNKRAMAPNGNIYFPGTEYREDFSLSSVPLALRALFMHEATHLYQWYGLGQWVFIRGPFDRQYDYELVAGRALKDYRLEQMGKIVEHFYIFSHGGRILGNPYNVGDYRDAVPVRS